MNVFLVALGCLGLFLLYLFIERLGLERHRENIPVRIAVTGTRGKSTVTRLIASALREAGFRVLAKTTGSKPVLIYPDGAEKEIERPGRPTILEQKRVLRAACAAKAKALVAEMMSIRPENLKAESERLLRPQVLVLTNVRLDHVDDMGRTKPEIAASLAAAIPAGSTVFVTEEEFYPVFKISADRKKARLIKVPQASAQESLNSQEFAENSRLSLAVAEFLGIRKEAALEGMAKAGSDFGGLKIWRMMPERKGAAWFAASAFAANEPESTARVLLVMRQRFPKLPQKMIALLNLREDRGDRTLQWLVALKTGFFDGFEHLVFIGGHAPALGRTKFGGTSAKAKISALAERRPQEITKKLFSLEDGEGVIVGMGNMGGLGAALVDYWDRIGVSL